MASFGALVAFALLLSLSLGAESFSPSSSAAAHPPRQTAAAVAARRCHRRRAADSSNLSMSSSEVALPLSMDDEDDDEMEWVEEEFELLTERDFYNTEWKIGTLMDSKPQDSESIDTTWVRLVTTETGDNMAVWGDDSKGKWTIDVPSQFFSISKESFGGWLGKQIWAGTIEDFYYLEGTVRGWSPISPASVVGQWQGVRLGVVDGDRVTLKERGVAPWFAAAEDENDERNQKDAAEDENDERTQKDEEAQP